MKGVENMTQYMNVVITPWLFVFLVVISVWSLVWTAIALWKSARNNQVVWFIVMLLLNTMGLLEIIYLAFFQRNKNVAMPGTKAGVSGGNKKLIKQKSKLVKRKKRR